MQRVLCDENAEDFQPPKRQRKSNKKDNQPADALSRIADCLESMAEEARMDRRILIDVLKSMNSVVNKSNT